MTTEPLMLQESPMKMPPVNGIYGQKAQFRSYDGSTWYHCRDQFHDAVGKGKNRCKGFYYGAEDPFALVAVIDWLERALNIKPEYRCRIFFCQSDIKKPLVHPVFAKDNMVYVEMSEFWREEKIRFYFLTALCRSSVSLTTWKHPLDTILQVSYFISTRAAVGAFLKGYTILTGNHKKTDSNWCNLFFGNEWKDLARPSSKDELKYFYDEDCRPNMLPSEKWTIMKWVRSVTGEGYADDGRPPFSF